MVVGPAVVAASRPEHKRTPSLHCYAIHLHLNIQTLNTHDRPCRDQADAGVNAAVALAPLASLSGSLAVLRLSYLDLHGDLPPVLWGLTALRELALEQNFIEVRWAWRRACGGRVQREEGDGA